MCDKSRLEQPFLPVSDLARGYSDPVSEHLFDPGAAGQLDDESATARAADLAERLLDEVARPRHSWHAIERMASALAQLAALMIRPTAPPPGP
jgi:hypothetical protein